MTESEMTWTVGFVFFLMGFGSLIVCLPLAVGVLGGVAALGREMRRKGWM